MSRKEIRREARQLERKARDATTQKELDALIEKIDENRLGYRVKTSASGAWA